jgi:predicted NACHT family NTPase
VLAPLSAYAAAVESGDVPLKDFIGSYYRGRNVELPVDSMLDEALEQGAAMVLLDGLDEVQAVRGRQMVVERIEDFCSFHKGKGNKFVLTSRIIGYRDVRPYNIEGLMECTLVDFEPEDIELFARKWTLAVEKAAQDHDGLARQEAKKEKKELLRAVERNPGVSLLASNPLLLTILALMKRQGVSLPERRVQLYDQYVKTLIRHWNLARGLDKRGACELDDVDTIRMLAPLALWMHTQSASIGLVKRAALREKLERLFREKCAEDPQREARAFLDSVREHTALLLERGRGQYGFIHLTFQE